MIDSNKTVLKHFSSNPDKDTRMIELYACGHNRVWKKTNN